MEQISIERTRKICEEYGLKPGKVQGTEVINIVKENNPRIEDISWVEFGQILEKRGLAVYRSENDWLKIMKKR